MLRRMTERAGIVASLNNHSLRATIVTVVSAKNIEARKIKAITGHKSDTSIESYCERSTLKQFKQNVGNPYLFIHGEESPESSVALAAL